MTEQTTPSQRTGLRDEIVNALGRIETTPPVEHRRQQADQVLAVLYREWPWLRAEAEEVALDPELRRQLAAAIKALGASETENAELRARVKTLEHVAAGNKRHVQLIVPALEHAESTVTRVISLYEQWVKAGPPPLGVPLARWWDARLVELHDAILPATDTTKEQ